MASPRKFPALTITIDQAMYDRLREELASVPDGIRKAEVGAINRVLPKGRTIVVDSLYDVLAIKTKRNIRDRTDIIKANRSTLSGTIKILGRKIALTNFKFKDTRNKKTGTGHGVNVQIYRGGQTLNFPHAFVGIGVNDNRQVFKRLPGRGHIVTDLAHYKPNIGRRMQDLKSIQGESLLTVFKEHPDMMRNALEKIQSELNEALLSQIDRFLHRRKSDRPA